eukprot:TRINITY_DN3453_c0_g1_i4.p1 TRINITY_DN3453_c0_g1~~TRINITY_DN3453_c0_g1_i4.p1  ORF type:complete len:338 (-),score=89.10 TRINITY_DN3453_c0_g1_i4:31-963(-)
MSIQWRKSTLRVTDLASNIEFFTKHFGFTLLRSSDASADLTILRNGESGPSDPKSADAVDFVLAYDGQVLELELTTESGLHNGNTDPYRGFGHIAVNAGDVYKVCDKLVADGVKFKKLPDEGRMKGLAFAFGPEPEQYWIEIVERNNALVPADWPTFNLSQTMLRVKSVDESVKFYAKLGMKVIAEKHFGPESGDFSLYFLASVSDERLAEAKKAAEGSDDVQFCDSQVVLGTAARTDAQPRHRRQRGPGLRHACHRAENGLFASHFCRRRRRQRRRRSRRRRVRSGRLPSAHSKQKIVCHVCKLYGVIE